MGNRARSQWRTMASAPKDGTDILVTETPNGEHYNVMLACWMAYGCDNLNPNDHKGDWWGVTPAHWGSSEGPLHVRWKPLAITPICWMPLPALEPMHSIRRRKRSIEREEAKMLRLVPVNVENEVVE